MKTGQCPKCSSSKIMHNMPVIDRNGEYPDQDLSVRIERNPKALIRKGAEFGSLYGEICSNCGYVEMYATNLQKLWQIYCETR